jgi:hypothetical protein
MLIELVTRKSYLCDVLALTHGPVYISLSSKMIIRTLTEAQAAAQSLADFLGQFNRTLGSLAGGTNGQPEATPPSPGPQNESQARQRCPSTMPDRVFSILGAAREPGLSPKEMVARYEAMGWPAPRRGRLYTAIFSSVHYLTKKGKLNKSNDGKYSIAQETG